MPISGRPPAVPFAIKLVALDGEYSQFLVADPDPFRGDIFIEDFRDAKALAGRGAAPSA
jgi:hypothetical protein